MIEALEGRSGGTRAVVGLFVTLCVIVLAWAGPARADNTFADSSFENVTLASGLDFPTTLTWAPDGRMFIAEKFGYVRVVKADGTLLANPIIDIHDHVVPTGDRGLLGLAAAPVPASGGDVRLYMLYTKRGTGNPANQATDESLSAASTLTDVTVHSNNTVSSETTVLGSAPYTPASTATDTAQACTAETADCIPSEGYTHTIGTVQIDPNDGSLWVSTGDGYADGAYTDNASAPYHLRAQDPNSLAGKILHIHTDGTGYTGSPFCPPPATSTTDNCSKVWAEGFRNPFRFTLRHVSPGVSQPVGGDVGEGNWEELNDEPRGYNAGWPCYEGPTFASGAPYGTSTQCMSPTTAFQSPFYLFDHYEGGFPSGPNFGGAVVGGPVYTGATYPSSYTGKVFSTDYVHGWIRYHSLTTSNAATNFSTFLNGDAGGRGVPLVSLQQAPDGNLVDVQIYGDPTNPAPATGSVSEIEYAPTDKSPVAQATVPASCTTSQTVQFTGDASIDPDGDKALTYFWDFGDGSTSTGTDLAHADPQHTYASAGTYQVRLKVTDSNGNSNNAFLNLTIGPGATPPNASISAPTIGSGTSPNFVSSDQYIAGKKITLSGGTTSGAGSQMSWEPVLVHGGTHTHVLGVIPTPSGDVPDAGNGIPEFDADNFHGADSYYLLRFTVTKNGCSTTLTERMNPQTGQYTLDAQDQSANKIPVPMTFTHTSVPDTAAAPHPFTVAKNAIATASAPQTWINGGWTYAFDHWAGTPTPTSPNSASTQIQPFSDNLAASVETLTAFYNRSNRNPSVSISSPTNGSSFVTGRQIKVSGSGTDPEDGALTASSLTWNITRTAHGTATPMGSGSGSSISFTPDAAGDLSATYTITLTATDSHGAHASTQETLHAASARVTLASRPAGIAVTSGPTTRVAPFTLGPLVSGSVLPVSAPLSASVGGATYQFVGWSDRGAAAHMFVVPSTNATLTASYIPPPHIALAHSRLHKPRSLGGRLTRSAAPVTRLQLALRPAKVKGRGCVWWSVKRHRLVHVSKACATPSWLKAQLSASHGTTNWTLKLGAVLPPGAYRLLAQSRDSMGRTAAAAAASGVAFTVTR